MKNRRRHTRSRVQSGAWQEAARRERSVAREAEAAAALQAGHRAEAARRCVRRPNCSPPFTARRVFGVALKQGGGLTSGAGAPDPPARTHLVSPLPLRASRRCLSKRYTEAEDSRASPVPQTPSPSRVVDRARAPPPPPHSAALSSLAGLWPGSVTHLAGYDLSSHRGFLAPSGVALGVGQEREGAVEWVAACRGV